MTEPRTHSKRVLTRTALNDMLGGAKMWRIWLTLSWEELKSTYRRSLLGIVWIFASFAGFIFVKILIFSNISSDIESRYYSAYIAVGFFAFQYITATVSTAPTVFVSAELWIKNDPLPLSVYVFKSVARDFYTFLLTSLVVVLVLIYLRLAPGPTAFLIFPATLLYIVNAIWIKFFLATLATRYRDITHLTQTSMRIMLFLSPIFWLPSQLGDLMDYLWWNPIFHFMEILRNPLLDTEVSVESWYFALAVTVLGWCMTLGTFVALRHRIVFWL